MVDRNEADRIIVRTNERMAAVINWYLDNRSWLDKEEFFAPLEMGVVDLLEEDIEFTFESKGKAVEIAVYSLLKPNLPAIVTFDLYPAQAELTNIVVAPHLSKERREFLLRILKADETHRKTAMKYHSLMYFMAYYRENVKVEDKGRRTKQQAKHMRRDVSRPLPLVRKQYEIQDFGAKKMKIDKQKRLYTEPDHEVNVRGHIRHYKSGKSVWIKPFSKYKGKGTKTRKEYQL